MRARRPDRAGVGGALRHHRPAEEVDAGTAANVPMRGIEPHGAGGARGGLDRRGPDVAVRHQRGDRRPRRQRRSSPASTSATTIASGQNTWKVVGIFEADGGVAETEIWCDARVLQGAYRRGNTLPVGARAARLAPRRFDTFRDWLTANPQLNVSGAARDRVLRAAVAGADAGSSGRSASASPR